MDDQWRVELIRSLRRLWLVGMVLELAVIFVLAREGAWEALPPVVTAALVLGGCRWVLSDRGQVVFERIRSGRS